MNEQAEVVSARERLIHRRSKHALRQVLVMRLILNAFRLHSAYPVWMMSARQIRSLVSATFRNRMFYKEIKSIGSKTLIEIADKDTFLTPPKQMSIHAFIKFS